MYGNSQQSLNELGDDEKISVIEMTTENKLYPNLPSAPPDPIVFRLEKLKDIEKEVKSTILNKRNTYKKYSKVNSTFKSIQVVCTGLSVGSTTGGIATALTVVGLPISIALASVAAVSGFISLASVPILNYTESKKKKHDRVGQILKIFLLNLNNKISKFTSDGNLSDDEFEEITSMYLKVREELDLIKHKQIKAESANIKNRVNELQKDIDKLK